MVIFNSTHLLNTIYAESKHRVIARNHRLMNKANEWMSEWMIVYTIFKTRMSIWFVASIKTGLVFRCYEWHIADERKRRRSGKLVAVFVWNTRDKFQGKNKTCPRITQCCVRFFFFLCCSVCAYAMHMYRCFLEQIQHWTVLKCWDIALWISLSRPRA